MNKRFTDVWCCETGHIGFTEDGVDKKFTGSEFEEFLNNLVAEELESIPKEEGCASVEEPKKMGYYIDTLTTPMLCRALSEQLLERDTGEVLLLLSIGSISLSIDNPNNFLCITRDYIEIFNDDTQESTFLKIDELFGFVFQPEDNVCDCDGDCDCEC